MKFYRILDGTLWRWESNGEFIRMIKIADLIYDGKPATIYNFAELLVEEIKKNSRKIVYNLR